MIHEKLLKIQSEIRGLTKDKAAFNYDYVTGDKLLGEIRPRMNELGLLLMPEVTEVRTQEITYDSWNKREKFIERKTEVLTTVMMLMTWVDTVDGDRLTQKWAATGANSLDKGFGSALTYGERYYLLKLFHIPTDKDDVDAIAKERDEAIELAAGEGRKSPSKRSKKVEVANTLDGAVNALKSAKTRQELDIAWATYPQFQNEPAFISAADETFGRLT